MLSNREKLLVELSYKHERIGSAIAQLNSGLDWQTPEERAEFELEAKRQWLCGQLGIAPGNDWQNIVKYVRYLQERIEAIRSAMERGEQC